MTQSSSRPTVVLEHGATRRPHRSPRRLAAAGVSLALLAGLTTVVATGSSASATPAPDATAAKRLAGGWHGVKPTIVLVHGAFADASGWNAEIEFLTQAGFRVIAPANPLRSLAGDAAYIDGVLDTISGPIVLVGHSYGGAVIAAAAKGRADVTALVYVSAFIPEAGHTPDSYILPENYPGSLLTNDTLLVRPTQNGGKPDSDVYIQPTDFRAVFAGDQSPAKASVLAAEQRPLAASAFFATAKAPATQPSWDLISLDDKAIPPAAQRHMAQQAHAHTVSIRSAHDSLITHPEVVDYLILTAAAGVH